jgi:membrane-associated phospholipid phosphatase
MYFPFELELVKWLQSLSSGLLDAFFNGVSFFGEEIFIIIIIGFTYWCYNKKMGEYIGFALTTSYTFNNYFKDLFSAPRPFEVSNDVVNMRPDTATGHSFPSGHAQGSATAFSSIAFWLKKRWMWIIAIVMMVLMSLSRMYLGVHFLRDVLVGSLLGVAIAYLTYRIFQKYSGTDEKKLHLIYITTVIVFLPVALMMHSEDFFKGYGILVGFVLAILFEKKYVKFTTDVNKWKKVIRFIVGLVIALVVQQGLKLVFSPIIDLAPSIGNVLHFIRYVLIAFAGFGLYPYLFKKFNF